MLVNKKNKSRVKFISYTGEYPNLCSGVLTLEIDGKEYKFTLKAKKKVSKTATLKIKVVNKSKKTLFSEKFRLKNGEFDYLETAEDSADEV